MWCRTCISTCKCCHVSLVLRQLFPGTFPPCLTADVVTSCTNYTSWLPNHSHISHISHIISHITYSYIYICSLCMSMLPEQGSPKRSSHRWRFLISDSPMPSRPDLANIIGSSAWSMSMVEPPAVWTWLNTTPKKDICGWCAILILYKYVRINVDVYRCHEIDIIYTYYIIHTVYNHIHIYIYIICRYAKYTKGKLY